MADDNIKRPNLRFRCPLCSFFGWTSGLEKDTKPELFSQVGKKGTKEGGCYFEPVDWDTETLNLLKTAFIRALGECEKIEERLKETNIKPIRENKMDWFDNRPKRKTPVLPNGAGASDYAECMKELKEVLAKRRID